MIIPANPASNPLILLLYGSWKKVLKYLNFSLAIGEILLF